jgi:hypothetical protein
VGQIGLGAASATMMLATVAAIVVPYLYSELRSKAQGHEPPSLNSTMNAQTTLPRSLIYGTCC